MRNAIKTGVAALGLYLAGLLTGAWLVYDLTFVRGEVLGARIIQLGVRLTQSGTVPYWHAVVAPDPETVEPPVEPLRTAKAKK